MPLRRVLLLPLAVLLPLGLASCGGEAPPAVFAPLTYDYLRPIKLNVAALDVESHAATHGADDVAADAPVPPAQALTQMAHDRIFPGGGGGRAVFVIQDASVLRHGGTLAGSLAVRLEVVGPDGRRSGFAEARVARSSSTEEGDLRTRLYALTRQMMDDMNVEFEYQVRHSLRSWLQPDADVPGAVSVQPLDGPAAVEPSRNLPGTRPPAEGPGPATSLAPAAGGSVPGYGGPAGYGAAPAAMAPPSGTMSPPPTSLALPPGSQGAPAAGMSPYGSPAYASPPSPQSSYGQPAPYAPPFYSPSPYSAPPVSQPVPYDRGPQSGPLPLTPD